MHAHARMHACTHTYLKQVFEKLEPRSLRLCPLLAASGAAAALLRLPPRRPAALLAPAPRGPGPRIEPQPRREAPERGGDHQARRGVAGQGSGGEGRIQGAPQGLQLFRVLQRGATLRDMCACLCGVK